MTAQSFCAYQDTLYISPLHISKLLPYLARTIEGFDVHQADQGQVIMRNEQLKHYHIVGSYGALTHFIRFFEGIDSFQLIQTSQKFNARKVTKVVNLLIPDFVRGQVWTTKQQLSRF